MLYPFNGFAPKKYAINFVSASPVCCKSFTNLIVPLRFLGCFGNLISSSVSSCSNRCHGCGGQCGATTISFVPSLWIFLMNLVLESRPTLVQWLSLPRPHLSLMSAVNFLHLFCLPQNVSPHSEPVPLHLVRLLVLCTARLYLLLPLMLSMMVTRCHWFLHLLNCVSNAPSWSPVSSLNLCFGLGLVAIAMVVVGGTTASSGHTFRRASAQKLLNGAGCAAISISVLCS